MADHAVCRGQKRRTASCGIPVPYPRPAARPTHPGDKCSAQSSVRQSGADTAPIWGRSVWRPRTSSIAIPAGKVYLSPIIDCFDGLVIRWSIGSHPDAELVNTMLDAAIETVADGNARPIVHSDRGAHYRWPGWLSRIGDAKLIRSMSRKGCSPDSAAGEGFFGRLKTELFFPRDWKATTIEQFIQVVDSYIRR